MAGVPQWASSTSGTVTSVALSVPSILSVTGSPITSSGTLAITTAVAPTGTGAIVLQISPTLISVDQPIYTPSGGISTPLSTSLFCMAESSSSNAYLIIGKNYSTPRPSTSIPEYGYMRFFTSSASAPNYLKLGIFSNSELYLGTDGWNLTAPSSGAACTMTGSVSLTGTLTVSGNVNLASLTASSSVATDASKNLVSVTNTGTGNNVLATSPTLVTPVLGAATGTSLQLSGLTASSALATDASKNLVSVTNTGTGNNVLATSPTLVTPVLGAATGTSLQLSGLTASSALATDASKNLVSVTNTGTGNNVLATSPTLVTPVLGAATGTSLQLSGLTASSALATDASKNLVSVTNTGSGNNVLATSPTLVTPVLGVATGTSLSLSGTLTATASAACAVFGPTTLASTNITVRGSSTQTIDIAISGATDNYSTGSVAGDAIIRATSGNLLLQRGIGAWGVAITATQTFVSGSFSVTGTSTLGGNLGLKVFTTSGTTPSAGSTNTVAIPTGVTQSNVISMTGVAQGASFTMAAFDTRDPAYYWSFYFNNTGTITIVTGPSGSSVAGIGYRLTFITNS